MGARARDKDSTYVTRLKSTERDGREENKTALREFWSFNAAQRSTKQVLAGGVATLRVREKQAAEFDERLHVAL